MTPERPASRSEHLLRSTLQRSPAHLSPAAHRRRHSHAPPSSLQDDDQLWRAAFLYRTAATASSPLQHRASPSPSPTRDYYSHDSRSRSRAASPSHYNRASSPSPRSSRRQSLHRSPASDSSNLQRHNSIPARKRSAPASASVPTIESQLTPHEQVLRARLERVLIAGRVVDERERSRERHHQRRASRDDSASSGWPWSDHPVLASTPPKSTTSSDHGHSNGHYHTYIYQTHHRSRSKTDPLTSPPFPPTYHPRRATASATLATTTPAPSSPYLLPNKPSSLSSSNPMAVRQQYHRNNSGSSAWTPPLTADASPVLSEPHAHSLPEDVDTRLLLTPPPTPPFGNTATGASSTVTATPIGSTRRPGVAMYNTRTRESAEYCSPSSAASPYLYRRDMDGSVEQLALPLPVSLPHVSQTFNARKASERCRMMEGYVSFAQVEGLGTPPDGVDDGDDHNRDLDGDGVKREEGKRGRGLIGTWARKLFVGVAAAQS